MLYPLMDIRFVLHIGGKKKKGSVLDVESRQLKAYIGEESAEYYV